MSNDVTTSGSSTAISKAEAMAANFRRVAAKAQSNVSFAKFVKGKYKAGGDDITGRSYLALMDQLRHGWIKFEGGKVVTERVGKVADGYVEDNRDDLGDLDKGRWEIDMSGRPRDPWVFQYFLPLLDQETGAAVVFVTNSKGGLDAVGALSEVYALNLKLGLPVVKLAVGSYEHKSFGRIEIPNFLVTGWNGSGIVAPEIEVKAKAMEAPVATKANDMDDEIPF